MVSGEGKGLNEEISQKSPGIKKSISLDGMVLRYMQGSKRREARGK